MLAAPTTDLVFDHDASLLGQITPTAEQIKRSRRHLHLKAASIGVLAVVSYRGLVFGGAGIPMRLVYASLLVLAVITTATGIMHDGNHASFSRSRAVNKAAAYSADMLGASSWVWRFKHNHLHHGNTNVLGMDSDIDQAPFARLAPAQTWRPWHRYQHIYLWFLYGFLAIRWFLMSDYRDLIKGGIGPHPFPRKPRKHELAVMASGKLVHATWALIIPLMFHPWWIVLTFYVACSWVVGFALALMFQVAHCVDIAEFTAVDAPRRGPDFVDHQMLTTADVDCRTKAGGAGLHFVMGGLDRQVEHHLLPRLPHTLYPAVAKQLRRVAGERGITVRSHASPWQAVRSHAHWLRVMGRQPVAA